VRLDAAASRERDERDLDVTGLGGERALPHAEEQVAPAGGLRGHLLPLARAKQELRQTSSVAGIHAGHSVPWGKPGFPHEPPSSMRHAAHPARRDRGGTPAAGTTCSALGSL